MAEALSLGLAQRQRRSARRAKKAKQRTGSLTSSDCSFRDSANVPDVEGYHRVRAGFYEIPPENHRRSSAQMTHDHEPRRRHTVREGSRERTVSTQHGHRVRSHSGHRRRRRKPREEVEEDGPVYVYRSTSRDGRERRTSTANLRTQEEERQAPVIPPRIRVLRTLGLEPAIPLSEYREERRPSRPPLVRRNASPGMGRIIRVGTIKRSDSVSKTPANIGRPRVTRSVSMRETQPRSASRPVIVRSQSTTQRSRRISPAESPLAPVEEETRPISSSPKKPERPTGILGSIFGPSRPAEPEKQISCLTCGSDDIPISKSGKLACGHRMCHPCLRRIFTMSVTDPAHMPPTCCTSDHIPLKHVDKLFDVKFKMKWNKKYQEYTTKNRTYCPAKGCGEWIKPANIHVDTSGGVNGGRKYGKCQRCRTKVCVTCNGKWHTGRECPKDESTTRFAEIAKEAGWQRCYNCSAMVELKEGCNHMTCRCRAEFCMICGVKWKGCDCPWFNYQTVENDRLLHMNVAQARQEGLRADGMPRAYHEELARRREQERRDEDLARRMQGMALADHNYPGGLFELANGAGHFMNDRFRQQATNILTANYGRTQGNAANVLLAEYDRPVPRGLHVVDLPPSPPPPPPPPPAPEPLLLRRHASTATWSSINLPQRRASERLVPRRTASDYATEAARHRPPAARELAGLNRSTTTGRVNEWRRHVEDDPSVPLIS
ncbi:hypothetical protein MMC30_000344 [Trapelia coarctata]|nr:hypothetical protein [Trapelia coarctata]